MPFPRSPIPQRKRQQGVSLFIIIVLVLLSMLLALWASRTALYNELVVGHDADYQRAYEAAQAMLQDAELDIRTSYTLTAATARQGVSSVDFTSESDEAFETWAAGFAAQATRCFNGICTRRTGAQDFWNDPTQMTAMTAGTTPANYIGARYGAYTGASATATGNPILTVTTAGQGAWYWVEQMKFNDAAPFGPIDPNQSTIPANPFVGIKHIYRITAIARGLKPATQVVLQSMVILQPGGSGKGENK